MGWCLKISDRILKFKCKKSNTTKEYIFKISFYFCPPLLRAAVSTLCPKTSQPSSPPAAQFPWTLSSPPTLPNSHQRHKLSFRQSWPPWGHRVWGLGLPEGLSPVGPPAWGWGPAWRDLKGSATSSDCHPTNCACSCNRGCRAPNRWGRTTAGFSSSFISFRN